MVTLINAENSILGRLASYIAKKALLGEKIIVLNSEKAIISGKKKMILRKEIEKLNIQNLGNPRRGPFYQRRPDRYVRKVIRGMLPRKKARGKEAYKRVLVYIGMPKEEIQKKHKVDITKEKIENFEGKKQIEGITVKELCKFVSGK